MEKEIALEILRELVARFEMLCKDEDGKTDQADLKRIKQARAAINALYDRRG